jgi:hypothetical protein
MGSSRYDDSESITFIFFAPRGSSQNLSRVGGYSRAIRQEPHRKINAKRVEVFFCNYMARDRRVAAVRRMHNIPQLIKKVN